MLSIIVYFSQFFSLYVGWSFGAVLLLLLMLFCLLGPIGRPSRLFGRTAAQRQEEEEEDDDDDKSANESNEMNPIKTDDDSPPATKRWSNWPTQTSQERSKEHSNAAGQWMRAKWGARTVCVPWPQR